MLVDVRVSVKKVFSYNPNTRRGRVGSMCYLINISRWFVASFVPYHSVLRVHQCFWQLDLPHGKTLGTGRIHWVLKGLWLQCKVLEKIHMVNPCF